MRLVRLTLPFLLGILATTAAAKHAASPMLASYARAAEVVRRAVEAHGGLAPIRDLRAITYRWEGEMFERYGGRDATAAFDETPPTQPVRVTAHLDLEAIVVG